MQPKHHDLQASAGEISIIGQLNQSKLPIYKYDTSAHRG
jgi:hypothetical protein